MIQIFKLRGKGMVAVPGLSLQSIQQLFNNSQHLALSLGKDAWNVYYTVAHHEPVGERTKKSFQSQDVIAFDIDGIDHDANTYIKTICRALGVESDTTAVVASGNGLHIFIRISPITNVEYFKKFKPGYKAACDRINAALRAEGLAGNADTTCWDPARVLRLPWTENRKVKDGKDLIKQCVLVQGDMTLKDFVLVNPIEDVAPTEQVQYEGLHSPRVDVEYILNECLFLKACKENPGFVKEPQWYAFLSIASRFRDNNKIAYQYSKQFNSSDIDRSDVDDKIRQALKASGPRTCRNISGNFNGCTRCKHWKKLVSPITLRSKDFIPTEHCGFTTITLDKGKQKVTRHYGDFQKWLDREYHYLHFGKNNLFLWRDGYYQITKEEEILYIVASKFFPSMYRNQRSEALSCTTSGKYTHESFFDNDNIETKVNLKNGVYDIGSGKLEKHSPKYPFQYVLNLEYGDSPTTLWDQYLDAVTCGRPHLQRALEEYMGFIFSGCDYSNPHYQKILILFGRGKNGKTPFVNIIRNMLGRGRHSSHGIIDLEGEYRRADLANKLLNVSEDQEADCLSNPAFIKEFTGGNSTIQGRRIRQDIIEFTPRAKFIVTMNPTPVFKDLSGGWVRRPLIIPFDLDFRDYPEKEIPDLYRRIKSEYKGIFARCMKLWAQVLKEGPTKIPESEAIVKDAVEISNPVLEWFEDFVVVTANPNDVCHSDTMYEHYLETMQANASNHYRTQRATFMRKLYEIIPKHKDKCQAERVWVGGIRRRGVRGVKLTEMPNTHRAY